MAGTDKTDAEVAKLADDIAVLKEDIANIASTLREIAGDRRDVVVAEGRRRIAAVQSDAHEQLDLLHRRADDFARQARDTVQERPGTALLIAAAIGMMFGYITARK